MQWKKGRRSDNVEDVRDQRTGGGGGMRIGGGKGLSHTEAVITLCHHRVDFRQAGQDPGHGFLRGRLRPVAVDRTDDFQLRVLARPGHHTGMDQLIH